MTEEPKARRRRGWLIWGSVAAFIVVLVVFVVPGYLSFTRVDGEHPSIHSLKTLTSAEADFRFNDRDDNKAKDYWVGDVSRLYYLKARGERIKLIELSVANSDAAPLEPLEEPFARAGYKFIAMKTDEAGAPYDRGGGRNPEKFAFCAFPERYQTDAWHRTKREITVKTFIVNESNVIYRKDNGAQPVTRWPKDPAAEGWVKYD